MKKIFVAILLVISCMLLTACGSPEATYKRAQDLLAKGEYRKAYDAFWSLNGYLDSSEQATIAYQQYIKVQEMEKASVGSYVTFGTYEQDANMDNGEEDIEWLVLAKENNRLLVVSRYVLDTKPYNEERADVTWETCTLREWLNNDFLKAAFSSTEQAMIPTVVVSADENPAYSTYPGNTTQDKVFLLSIPEANKYLISDSDRVCKGTVYATYDGCDSWPWWFRSPGHKQSVAAVATVRRDHGLTGDLVHFELNGVRPALWISWK